MKAPRAFDLDLFESATISDETIEGVGRWYTLTDGTRYPSVTTVLKAISHEGIERWKERIGHQEAAKQTAYGASRGSALHQVLEDYLSNGSIDRTGMMSNTLAMFKQIKPMVDDNLGKIHGIEIGMFSHTLRTAGRADCVGHWNGSPAIIDLKTSKKVKNQKYLKSYIYQTTAYAIMMEEQHGFHAEKLVLIFGHDNEKDGSLFVFPRTKKLDAEVKNFFYTETSHLV